MSETRSPRIVCSTTVGIVYWLMIVFSPSSEPRGPDGRADVGDLGDHLVDEAVLQCLFCGEPAVPAGVGVDGLLGLAGVLGDQGVDQGVGVVEVRGLDL